MTMPRDVQEVEGQLNELRELIAEGNSLGINDFASRLQMRSMEALEKDLRDELKAAQLLKDNAVMQISLDGGPVRDHAIDSKLLGMFLIHFQELANAVGQAFGSRATRSGSIQKKILQENQLYISSFLPSSFAVNFARPPQNGGETVDQTDIPDSLDFLYRFFDASAPLSDLTEVVSIPRVKNHYLQVVKLLENNNATLQVRTRRRPYAATFTQQAARERRQWITRIQNDITSINVTGVLNAAHLRFNSFEIEGDDGIFYNGRVTEHALFWLRRIPLGSHVEAEILQTIETHEKTELDIRTEYVLRLISSTTMTHPSQSNQL